MLVARLGALFVATLCLEAGALSSSLAARPSTSTSPSTSTTVRLRRVLPVWQSAGALSFLQVGSGAPVPPAPPPFPELYGTITVGTPPQEFTVVFDTASGDIVLPSRTCPSLGCLAHTSYDRVASTSATAVGKTAALKLGQGEVSGNMVQDTVCVGSLPAICSASVGLLEATVMTDVPFRDFPYDGIFGLGLLPSSLYGGENNTNFLQGLSSRHVLKSDMFGIWMANLEEGAESTINFGQLDSKRWAGDVLYLPTGAAAASTGRWQVNLTDISSNGVPLSLCGSGCQAVFDSGTSAIGAPATIVTALLAALDIQQDCSNFGQLKTIGFLFGKMELRLDPSDYVYRRPGEGCFHQFLPIDVRSSHGPVILLGHPFLRRYYTIYDRFSQSVGVAFATHARAIGDQETTLKKQKRMMKFRG